MEKQMTTTQYKDRLFRYLFKRAPLELYNAVSDEPYLEKANIKIINMQANLENIFSDLIFKINEHFVVICEHQSALNGNMPLRMFAYLSKYYQSYVNKKAIHKEKIIPLPTPRFFMLYNGDKELKTDVLRLSDAFANKELASVEIEVKVIDINYEKGHEALRKSTTLDGYSFLIAEIKKRLAVGMSQDKAIGEAILYCIEQGKIADFLRKNLERVAKMITFDATIEGREEARIEEAREEAIETERIRFALQMLKKELDVEFIAECVKMPIEWIENLKQQTQK